MSADCREIIAHDLITNKNEEYEICQAEVYYHDLHRARMRDPGATFTNNNNDNNSGKEKCIILKGGRRRRRRRREEGSSNLIVKVSRAMFQRLESKQHCPALP